jgi:DNA-binding ferritin-like protein
MKLPEFSSKPIGAARGYIMKTFFKDEASDQNAMSAVLKSFEKNNDQFAEIIKKLYQSKKALEGSEKMLQDFINTIKTEIPR